MRRASVRIVSLMKFSGRMELAGVRRIVASGTMTLWCLPSFVQLKKGNLMV